MRTPKFSSRSNKHDWYAMSTEIHVGPCAKARVFCTIVAPGGFTVVGENICRSPQSKCPRLPGEGYEKCRSICDQVGHAEAVAAQFGAGKVHGGVAYLEGHTYACDSCYSALAAVGVSNVVIGPPPVAVTNTRETP